MILTKHFKFAYIPFFIVVVIGLGGGVLRSIGAIRNGQGLDYYLNGVHWLIALPLALLIGWILNRRLSREEKFEESAEKIEDDLLAKLADEALKEHHEGRTEKLDPDKL